MNLFICKTKTILPPSPTLTCSGRSRNECYTNEDGKSMATSVTSRMATAYLKDPVKLSVPLAKGCPQLS